MTLGQAPAWAATIEVTPGTPPSIHADGKCSLIEAIVNANRDRRTHLDCVAGAGADTILLPAKSTQRLKAEESLPQITSRIVIEGRQSTIQRNTTQDSYLPFFRVGATGDLTLNKITVTGATASGVLGGTPGVFNDGGAITLNDSSVANAQTGVINRGGRAVLQRSTISGSGTNPGGLWLYYGGIDNGGTLVLTNSVVTGNVSHRGCRDPQQEGSHLTMIDSIVSNNFFEVPTWLRRRHQEPMGRWYSSAVPCPATALISAAASSSVPPPCVTAPSREIAQVVLTITAAAGLQSRRYPDPRQLHGVKQCGAHGGRGVRLRMVAH